jgi:hypothetical protein
MARGRHRDRSYRKGDGHVTEIDHEYLIPKKHANAVRPQIIAQVCHCKPIGDVSPFSRAILALLV